MHSFLRFHCLIRAIALVSLVLIPMLNATPNSSALRKVADVVIYRDDRFHCAFPSVVKRATGDLLLAFRRAPNRLRYGESRNTHTDPNSYLVTVRSADGGRTWTDQPELLYADAFGGSQDPCLLQLRDGTLLCASYGWTPLRTDGVAALPSTAVNYDNTVFNGGYYLRSTDGGKTWSGPFYPPHIKPELLTGPTGEALPAYNRGALVEGRNGRLLWAVAATDQIEPKRRTSVHLLISEDKGESWRYSSPIATDETVQFNETSVYETPKGDLIAFLRTADYEDQACIARSTDGGKTFTPWQGMGFQGHPLHALRLPDDRVLLTYGYRHEPMGIRARVLNAECTDFATAPEIVLRTDGGGFDLGYSWSVMADERHVLVAYYFNDDGGVPYIAGTLLAID